MSALEEEMTYVATTSVAAKRLAKRTACAPQPSGVTGYPVAGGDTASAFLSNAAFSAAATNAATPSGYSNAFTNLQASNSAYGYLGYTTLQSYDTNTCAAKCNAIHGCMSFNLYFERDPSVDPGTGCDNPASVTMIKCVFWGGPVSSGNANNKGQYRSNFQVVMAGSNGYVNNNIATPSGYGAPVPLGNAAINAPLDGQGYDTFMGSTIFSKGAFDVSLCAGYCDAQTAYNLAHPADDGSPVKTCQFFNTYILYVNDTAHPQGQYCSIYTESWASKYATNTGQYRGSDRYFIDTSFSFTNLTSAGFANSPGDKNGAIHQASKDISYSTLQPFCSSMLGYSIPVASVTATVSTLAVETSTVYSTATETSVIYAKRALSTPAALTKYPATVISSACALQATLPTSTSTTTVSTATVTPTTSTTVTTTTVTETSSTTSTTTVPTPTDFCLKVANQGLDITDYTLGGIARADANLLYRAAGTTTWPIKMFHLDSQNRLVTTGTNYIVAVIPTFYSSQNVRPIEASVIAASPATYAVLSCAIGSDGLLSCTAQGGTHSYKVFRMKNEDTALSFSDDAVTNTATSAIMKLAAAYGDDCV